MQNINDTEWVSTDGEHMTICDHSVRVYHHDEQLDMDAVTVPDEVQDLYDALLAGISHTRAIFDNGGGITLQLSGYAHHYDDPAQAATDWMQYHRDGHTDDWDGHEPELLTLDPSYDEIRNDGYEVLSADGIVGKDADDCSGRAMREFITAVRLGE